MAIGSMDIQEPGHRAPFLADSGSRWVIDFSDAPPGRFPFTVVGGGTSGDGAIVVEAR